MEACSLADKKCVPCQGGVPPITGVALQEWLGRLGGGWEIEEERRLRKTYRFRNFREALAYTNALGEIAEAEQHHPEITLSWGRVSVRIWTHKINGLTESDFVLAAKADRLAGM